MRTKLTDIQREFESDNKIIECHLTSYLYIQDLLDCFKIDNIFDMLWNDSRWRTFIEKELPTYENHCINLNNFNDSYFLINTTGKAICHDDDGFDKKYGEHLAEDRALQKALNIEIKIIEKIMNIFASYYVSLEKILDNNYKLIDDLLLKIREKVYDYDKL